MKKVAFLSFDWDYEVMSEYYRGVEDYVASQDDLQIVIFNAYGQYANYRPEVGALAFFDLCDLGRFDGLIIQGNRTWPVDLRQQIANAAHELGKPVVSISYELEGACYVGTDNYRAEYDLVRKVVSDYKLERPVFVNGLASSVEAQDRLRGFVDACEDCGVKTHRMYQANWEMDSGIATAREILAEPDDLPDAIFCCNDELAVGVQETLMAAGVRVGEDVKVTGFDNREYSVQATPRVTTVDRDFHQIGYTAAGAIRRLIDGEQLGQHLAESGHAVLGESCGYPNDDSRPAVIESLMTMDRALRHFYEVLARFQPAILKAESLAEILDECERSLREIGCEEAYLTLSTSYLESGADATATSYGSDGQLMVIGRPHPDLAADESHSYARYPLSSLLPDATPMGPGTYLALPLRQGGGCIGLFVTRGVPQIMRYGFLTFIITLISSAIESARQKELLQNLSSHLDTLYVHDQLTGLYNRFGLERFGRPIFERLLAEHGQARLLFVDVDNMKGINDLRGHEAGDRALRQTGRLLAQVSAGPTSFAMRFGGDEFLVVSGDDLAPAVEDGLRALNADASAGAMLSLSVGSVVVHEGDGLTLHDAIQLADTRMYEIKKARKAG